MRLAQIRKRGENSKKHAPQGSGKESRNGTGMVGVEMEFAVSTISRISREKVWGLCSSPGLRPQLVTWVVWVTWAVLRGLDSAGHVGDGHCLAS